MLSAPSTEYSYYRGHKLTDAPATEPVTLAEVKLQLGLEGSADDSLLNMYITAARQHAENMTGLALITQEWTLVLDNWPATSSQWWDGVRQGAMSELNVKSRAAHVLLPRYPLQTVDSITADGTSVTVADVFTVDTYQTPGRLVVKHGQTLPTVIESANGIVIVYTAGYGTASDVPSALKVALLQFVASLYTHRGDQCSVEDAWKNSGAKMAFDAYMVRGL